MSALFIRILSFLGLAALLGSIGVAFGVLAVQVPFGPVEGQSIWPTASLRISLLHTVWMAITATLAALLLSLPAAIGMSIGRPRGRQVVTALAILTLITMPSVFAYATLMITTSKSEFLRWFVDATGWNIAALSPMHAGLVQAWWLWPIPALLLAAAYRNVGAPSYRLALLDASPIRAFLRGALPPMRDSILAAAAAVFILSSIDSTVPPFMAAARVWGVELMADAAEASTASRPGAYLFFRAWPLVVIVIAVGVLALPSAWKMADWSGAVLDADTGRDAPLSRKALSLAVVFTFLLATLPIWIYSITMFDGRYGIVESFAAAWNSSRQAIGASLIVAAAAAFCSVAIALGLLEDPKQPAWRRRVRTAAAFIVGAVALFPPALIATTMITFFSNRFISPPDRWNLYDNTPIAWLAAMLCRHAFIPVFVARLANRHIPEELPGQAATDGASQWLSLVHTRLPHLWRPLIAAGLLVAGLSLSEVAASSLLQPSQWVGGSIAVWTDGQMHYGRHNHTTALGLMMITPGILAMAMMLAWQGWRRPNLDT